MSFPELVTQAADEEAEAVCDLLYGLASGFASTMTGLGFNPNNERIGLKCVI